MRHVDWTEPGFHRVADGVFRIPLPVATEGLRAVNVYALESSDGITLIDGGDAAFAGSIDVLDSALSSAGHRLREIRQVLVTHVHRDHYTLAIAIRRLTGCRVSLGFGERSSLLRLNDQERRNYEGQLQLLRQCGAQDLAMWLEKKGARHRVDRAYYELPDTWIHGQTEMAAGDEVLTAIPTPGHTRGHVVYLSRRNALLFSGDHVLPRITPSIGFEVRPPSLPLESYLGSLHKLRDLPDSLLLPAHGPVENSAHRHIDALVQHHDERLTEIHSALKRDPLSAYQVATVLPWTRRNQSFFSLAPFDQVLAVLETLAHLEFLREGESAVRIETPTGSLFTQ